MECQAQENHPRIGIRPTIDGRRKGVRESLENQTLTMARMVAELIQSTLRHRDGCTVECVIPTSCIGGVAEAARCADLFDRQNIGVTVTVTPCWCYGTETMDMDPFRPKAIWGANHGAISSGHIGADLIALSAMLRIPVCMHNVPEGQIFRPSAWNAFGMDKEGADFRACANYGPLYGR